MKISQRAIDAARRAVEAYQTQSAPTPGVFVDFYESAKELLRLVDFQDGSIGSGPDGELTPEDLQRLYDADYWQCLRPVSEEEVAGVLSFSQAFPEAMDRPLREVFGWRPLRIALERHGLPKWRCQFQKRGTCVGQGAKQIGDGLLALDYVLHGRPFPGRCAVAGMYPGSRVDVAGRPGTWDGSTGSWVTKWATERGGLLLLKHIGLPEDSLDEDERLAVKWCASREGVPTDLEDDARERVVAVGTLCRSTEELTAGLNAGGLLLQCSNLIASGRRDSRGYSPVRRSGGHCQVTDSCRGIQGRDSEGFWQQNSWDASWGSGGRYQDDDPPGGVWIDRDGLQAQLNQRDSYLWFGVNGPLAPDDQINL